MRITLAGLHHFKAAGAKKCTSHLWPTLLWQAAQERSYAALLGQGDVVEVQRARDRHAVVVGEDQFGGQAADCSRCGNHDHFIQASNDLVAGQDHHRAALVWKAKCVPPDLAAPHARCSQPSASHARGSSSLENSSRPGGVVPYTEASRSEVASIR